MRKEGGKNVAVGILALQGSFAEHKKMMESLGCKCIEVKSPKLINEIDGLIIPGGESTTMNYHLAIDDFKNDLTLKINSGMPVYGTCAGAILLAKTVDCKPNKNGLCVMDIDVSRNAYGSQMDSFEEDLNIEINGVNKEISAVYIRAPRINSVGADAKILAKNSRNEIVMVVQKNMLVTTFHPELTNDKTVHSFFLESIIQKT